MYMRGGPIFVRYFYNNIWFFWKVCVVIQAGASGVFCCMEAGTDNFGNLAGDVAQEAELSCEDWCVEGDG